MTTKIEDIKQAEKMSERLGMSLRDLMVFSKYNKSFNLFLEDLIRRLENGA